MIPVLGKCILRQKGAQCEASIKLSILDEFTGQNNENTHPPSQTQVEVTKAKASIKRKAENTEKTSQQIFASELRNNSEGAAANLPSLDRLEGNICHAHEGRNMLPNPQTREEITVPPQEYQLTTNGDQFLVFDKGIGDPERTFIFAREFLYLRQILAFNFYMNATIGTQMVLSRYALRYFTKFTLFMVNNAEKSFHVFFGLLPNETEATYTRFFRELFIRLENLGSRNPDDILVVFERVAINSIHNLNSQIELKCCF